jgi:hypothetical protein
MKNLIIITLAVVLASCGSSPESTKNNIDNKNIIGKSFKIGMLEVGEKDFPNQMNWEDAQKACSNLGGGWRLPTIDELDILYQNKDKFSGFANGSYWSSTEIVDFRYSRNFDNGGQDASYIFSKYYVRAVRTF